jgi:hypothetical protein
MPIDWLEMVWDQDSVAYYVYYPSIQPNWKKWRQEVLEKNSSAHFTYII